MNPPYTGRSEREGVVMYRLICGCVLGMALAVTALAQSADVAPDALAKKVTEEVLAVIRADKEIQSGNTKKVYDLVETKVLPHFNFTHMTRLAVGAPWRQATSAQQQSLTNEFRTLLVHTYTSAFTQYKDQVVEYKPLKLQPGDTDVVVRSLIKQKGGADPIDINYSMEKTDASWKVYDVAIAGVSLVQNYRSTFNSEIQKSGIDGLIGTLANKNKTLDQQSAGK
jgi:phospholipid transport system substrate-binding protein